MASFLQKHRSATVYSVALHIAIAGTFLLGGIRFSSPSRAMPNATPIEAVLIDPSTVQAQLEKIAERERAERERQQERDRLAREAEETARLERERELERLATLQQEREQAEREAEERAIKTPITGMKLQKKTITERKTTCSPNPRIDIPMAVKMLFTVATIN
jgi:TolA protein